MRVLLDTNILTRMADPSHPLHPLANDAVEKLHEAGHDLFIVPQVIYEFWSVATRTVEHNGMGLASAEAEQRIADFTELFRLLKDERTIYEAWVDLVTTHSVTGTNSFDARLAAAMRRHGLDHLLTFNAKDFRRYPHVNILDPHAIAVG